jgi:hypothetical protein
VPRALKPPITGDLLVFMYQVPVAEELTEKCPEMALTAQIQTRRANGTGMRLW